MGFMDKITGDDGLIDKILGFPDKFENPTHKKLARIGLSALGAILAVGVCYMMVRGGLADVGVTSMMGIGAACALGGVCLSWIIEDLLPKEYHRTASKIAALLFPFLMLAASSLLIYTFYQHGWVVESINSFSAVGVIALPMTIFAFEHAYDVNSATDAVYLHRRALRTKNVPEVPPPPPEYNPAEEIELEDLSA